VLVELFISSEASKSELGWDIVGLINGRRIKDYADDGEEFTRIYRHPLAACTCEGAWGRLQGAIIAGKRQAGRRDLPRDARLRLGDLAACRQEASGDGLSLMGVEGGDETIRVSAGGLACGPGHGGVVLSGGWQCYAASSSRSPAASAGTTASISHVPVLCMTSNPARGRLHRVD
jgi:hypothetical protein